MKIKGIKLLLIVFTICVLWPMAGWGAAPANWQDFTICDPLTFTYAKYAGDTILVLGDTDSDGVLTWKDIEAGVTAIGSGTSISQHYVLISPGTWRGQTAPNISIRLVGIDYLTFQGAGSGTTIASDYTRAYFCANSPGADTGGFYSTGSSGGMAIKDMVISGVTPSYWGDKDDCDGDGYGWDDAGEVDYSSRKTQTMILFQNSIGSETTGYEVSGVTIIQSGYIGILIKNNNAVTLTNLSFGGPGYGGFGQGGLYLNSVHDVTASNLTFDDCDEGLRAEPGQIIIETQAAGSQGIDNIVIDNVTARNSKGILQLSTVLNDASDISNVTITNVDYQQGAPCQVDNLNYYTTWANVAGNIYKANVAASPLNETAPLSGVTYNGTGLTYSAGCGAAANCAANTWDYYDEDASDATKEDNNLYVNVGEDPTSGVLVVSWPQGASNIYNEGIMIQENVGAGTLKNIKISGSHMDDTFGSAIYCDFQAANNPNRDITIQFDSMKNNIRSETLAADGVYIVGIGGGVTLQNTPIFNQPGSVTYNVVKILSTSGATNPARLSGVSISQDTTTGGILRSTGPVLITDSTFNGSPADVPISLDTGSSGSSIYRSTITGSGAATMLYLGSGAAVKKIGLFDNTISGGQYDLTMIGSRNIFARNKFTGGTVRVIGADNTFMYNLGYSGIVNYNAFQFNATSTGCTVFNNSVFGYIGDAYNFAESCSWFSNNVAWTITGDDIDIAAGKTVTGSHNWFEAAAAAGAGTYNSSTSDFSKADPLFVNTATFDFQLQPTSPLIDSGTNDRDGNGVWDDVYIDLRGIRVPKHVISDIGAYEYQWSVKSATMSGGAKKDATMQGGSLVTTFGN